MSCGKLRKPSIKNLECYLQDLEDFQEPKVELEQYATPPHIAAVMLNAIEQTYGDIEDKFVADLGCGTGRLTVGSLLCGASMVVGFDLDRSALKYTLKNIQNTFVEEDESDSSEDSSRPIGDIYRHCERFNLVQMDVANVGDDSRCFLTGSKFDTVIMNPPFGTKQNQGIDMLFLERAISMTDKVVYSLHKTSTRKHILGKCDQWSVTGKPIAQIRYNLDNTYKFHRKKSVDIEVDLWRVLKKKRV